MIPEPAAAYAELQSRLGFHLGYGRGADAQESAWTPNQQATIKEAIRTGLRMFYYCGYDWSFLKPVATLTLAAGASTVALPDDYASADGEVVVATANSSCWWALRFGRTQDVYQNEARQPGATGRPVYLCEEPLKGVDAQHLQRQQLHVWPAADQPYSLTFRYRLNPQFLSGDRPYAYGGPQHSQALLQACKAAAERDVDDLADGGQMAAFKQALEASVRMDRRNKPMTHGTNGDASDLLRRRLAGTPLRQPGAVMIQGRIY